MTTRKKTPAPARKKKTVRKPAAAAGAPAASKRKTASGGSKTSTARKKAPARKSPRKKAAKKRSQPADNLAAVRQPEPACSQESGADSLPSEGFVLLLDEQPDDPADEAPTSESTSADAGDGFVILLDATDPAPSLDGDRRIDLGTEIGLDQLPALHQSLLGLLSDAQPIEMDTSALREVDAASVQLLAAFSARAKALDVEIRWSEPSTALRRVAKTLDLGERFIQ